MIERAATSKRERKRKKCEWNGEWVFEQVINTMKGKWKRNCERLKKIGEERESKKVKEDRERGAIENGEREKTKTMMRQRQVKNESSIKGQKKTEYASGESRGSSFVTIIQTLKEGMRFWDSTPSNSERLPCLSQYLTIVLVQVHCLFVNCQQT